VESSSETWSKTKDGVQTISHVRSIGTRTIPQMKSIGESIKMSL